MSDSILIDKSFFGNNDDEKFNYNLYALAKKDDALKEIVIKLTINGFIMTDHKNGVSVFSRFSDDSIYKKIASDNDLFSHGRIIYALEEPEVKMKFDNKLIVVFSAVSKFQYNANILVRNFTPMFPTLMKYIPANTYILRISDIGGVVGGFYLDSEFERNNIKNIQSFIESKAKELGVDKNKILLYGASKGGTGSLYHALLGGYKAISVDPILSDEYHEITYNDSHFTSGGIFNKSKDTVFEEILRKNKGNKNIVVITSNGSPIFNAIYSRLKKSKVRLIDVNHPKIKTHPDVAKNTINIVTSFINFMLLDYLNYERQPYKLKVKYFLISLKGKVRNMKRKG